MEICHLKSHSNEIIYILQSYPTNDNFFFPACFLSSYVQDVFPKVPINGKFEGNPVQSMLSPNSFENLAKYVSFSLRSHCWHTYLLKDHVH